MPEDGACSACRCCNDNDFPSLLPDTTTKGEHHEDPDRRLGYDRPPVGMRGQVGAHGADSGAGGNHDSASGHDHGHDAGCPCDHDDRLHPLGTAAPALDEGVTLATMRRLWAAEPAPDRCEHDTGAGKASRSIGPASAGAAALGAGVRHQPARVRDATSARARRSKDMKPRLPPHLHDSTEEERLNPGSTPQRIPQPQPARGPRKRNKAALPGSQNEDLKGPKPGRGPRGAGT
jgi:hypothetical protein